MCELHRAAGYHPRNDFHPESTCGDCWVRVLLDEFANLIWICPPNAQAPEGTVEGTEQGSGGKQVARIVEVGKMRHMLIL